MCTVPESCCHRRRRWGDARTALLVVAHRAGTELGPAAFAQFSLLWVQCCHVSVALGTSIPEWCPNSQPSPLQGVRACVPGTLQSPRAVTGSLRTRAVLGLVRVLGKVKNLSTRQTVFRATAPFHSPTTDV